MQTDEKLRKELEELVQRSPQIQEIYRASIKSKDKSEFIRVYQSWFTLASRLVKLLAPERASEFDAYYKTEKEKTPESRYTHKGEQFKDEASYTILDYILGAQAKKYTGYAGGEVWNPVTLVEIKLCNQMEILNAIQLQLDQAVFNLSAELLMRIQDRELESARELVGKHPRSAGILVTCVLENHLDGVLLTRNISIEEEESGLGEKVELLKKEGLIDPIQVRRMQFLVDTANLCFQNSEKEPEQDDITLMIKTVDEVLKTIF